MPLSTIFIKKGFPLCLTSLKIKIYLPYLSHSKVLVGLVRKRWEVLHNAFYLNWIQLSWRNLIFKRQEEVIKMWGDWEDCTQEAVGIQLPADFPHSALLAKELYSGVTVTPPGPHVHLCSHGDTLQGLNLSDNFQGPARSHCWACLNKVHMLYLAWTWVLQVLLHAFVGNGNDVFVLMFWELKEGIIGLLYIFIIFESGSHGRWKDDSLLVFTYTSFWIFFNHKFYEEKSYHLVIEIRAGNYI